MKLGESAKTSLPPQIEVRRRGLRLRRHVSLIQPGLLRVAQEIAAAGRNSILEVSGPFWICGLVRVFRGGVRYRSGNRLVQPRGRFFGMFLPPYSIAEVELTGSRTFSVGFLVEGAAPPDAPRQPVLFEPASDRLPASPEDLLSLLAKSRGFQRICREDCPSPSATRLKGALDRDYAEPLRLGQIAQSLDLSPAFASRTFRKHYGISPSQYRQALRVLESMMRLAQGQPIVDVSLDVGFGDLSRFYRHFRRFVCTPPGRYRVRRSKIAKT
ncbi:MAG: helix-turn-helix domain-containing protein [Candidatus Acidiferrales bacterium]